MKKTVLIFCLLVLAGAAPFGKEVYVSPDGDDNHPGTRGKPVRSLSRASSMLQPGDICFLYGGTYREVLKPQVQGTAGKPVTYKAAEGERVIISAMEVLEGGGESGMNPSYREGKILAYQTGWSLGSSNIVSCNGIPLIQARWPNKKSVEPMDVEPATIIASGSSPKKIKCDQFPDTWTNESLEGATAWVNAESKWSSWTSHVTGYDPGARTILLKGFEESWWIDERHNPGRDHRHYGKGVFYLAGARELLDAPGEWYLDENEMNVFLVLPEGITASNPLIEMKKRELTADLRAARYVILEGIEFTGGPVDLSGATGCVVKGGEISHFCRSFGVHTGRGVEERTGILLGGKNNTIRDCRIFDSAGNGIILSGEGNAVINCEIFDINHLASHDCASLNLDGREHLISHNTIHNTGRVCISMNGGGHEIQYNHIFNPGRISEDLGVLKCAGLDADNLVIHHNVIHNDNGKFIGIYFDNYANNIIAHHNVVWGMKDGIRSNRPGHFHIIYNNTVIPDINDKWGPWPGKMDQAGNVIVNNVVNLPVDAKDHVVKENNHVVDFTIASAGKIPTFFFGSSVPDFPPYAGAIPPREEIFEYGHHRGRSPGVAFDPDLPFIRNYLKNGCFDYLHTYSGEYTDEEVEAGIIPHWEPILAGTAQAEYFPGFNFPEHPEHRFSIHGYSLSLGGRSPSGVIQTVEDMVPGRKYSLIAFLKTDSQANVTFTVNAGDRTVGLVESQKEPFHEGSNWKYISTTFEVPPGHRSCDLKIVNEGPGTAYIDDAGIIPLLGYAY